MSKWIVTAEAAHGVAKLVAPKVSGWRELGEESSNGNVTCGGCPDDDDHDEIPSGHPVFWSPAHPEYGDCDGYCVSCIIDDAYSYDLIDLTERAALLQSLVG